MRLENGSVVPPLAVSTAPLPYSPYASHRLEQVPPGVSRFAIRFVLAVTLISLRSPRSCRGSTLPGRLTRTSTTTRSPSHASSSPTRACQLSRRVARQVLKTIALPPPTDPPIHSPRRPSAPPPTRSSQHHTLKQVLIYHPAFHPLASPLNR